MYANDGALRISDDNEKIRQSNVNKKIQAAIVEKEKWASEWGFK